MPTPFQGQVGAYDNFNPTLLPNFSKQVIYDQNGAATVHPESPAQYNANNPQVAASATLTIGGTVNTGNTPSITLTQGQLTNGVISYTYTCIAGDTIQTVAEGLAAGLEKLFVNTSITVTAVEAVITVSWPGPTGNFAVLSFGTSGSITGTLSPVGGGLTGGSGPVYAQNNFNYTYNNSVMSFFYGQPYNLGNDLLSLLVAQGRPIQ